VVPNCPEKNEAKGQDTMVFPGEEAIVWVQSFFENQQLANVHNMDDDGIARLKTETELREQNIKRLS
jgi:hypothetical protein